MPDKIREALHELAKRDHIPEATKAARLLEVALELEEDLVWDKIAEKRDKKGARFIPHDQIWK